MTNLEDRPTSLYRTEEGSIRAAVMEFDDRISIPAEKVKFDVEVQEFCSETTWYSPKQARNLIAALQRCLENVPEHNGDSDKPASSSEAVEPQLEAGSQLD